MPCTIWRRGFAPHRATRRGSRKEPARPSPGHGEGRAFLIAPLVSGGRLLTVWRVGAYGRVVRAGRVFCVRVAVGCCPDRLPVQIGRGMRLDRVWCGLSDPPCGSMKSRRQFAGRCLSARHLLSPQSWCGCGRSLPAGGCLAPARLAGLNYSQLSVPSQSQHSCSAPYTCRRARGVRLRRTPDRYRR